MDHTLFSSNKIMNVEEDVEKRVSLTFIFYVKETRIKFWERREYQNKYNG